MKVELDSNNHSVFLWYYHLVLVVKYRRQVINESISARLEEIFSYVIEKYQISLEQWNTQEDHVRVLFKAHSKSEISKFLNAYKSASSRLIKKEFPSIRQAMEGIFLESKFLLAYHRVSFCGNSEKVYRKSR